MKSRPGFARLLPLMALSGLVAGTIALLASARPVQAPPPAPAPFRWEYVRALDDGSEVSDPAPARGKVDREERAWELADIPGGIFQGLDLSGAEWAGVDLHRATFLKCDFSACNLRGADMRSVTLWNCDFTDADLTDVDLNGATFDWSTRWPCPEGARFDPQAHGARRMPGRAVP